MRRKSAVAVLGMAVALMLVVQVSEVSAGWWHHRHRHYAGAYYSPVVYGYGYGDPCCTGARIDYAPYVYTGVPFATTPMYTTSHHHSFYRPYAAVGYSAPAYYSSGLYAPATYGYAYRPYAYPVMAARPAWTSAYYGGYGYSSMGWYGW